MKFLKNYLRFYPNCKMLNRGHMVGLVHENNYDFQNAVASGNYMMDIQNFVLALRHLSELTQDEAERVVIRDTKGKFSDVEIHNDRITYLDWEGDEREIRFNKLNPDQFVYLLSKEIDVFGLIEEGLAMDKAAFERLTQKKQPC